MRTNTFIWVEAKKPSLTELLDFFLPYKGKNLIIKHADSYEIVSITIDEKENVVSFNSNSKIMPWGFYVSPTLKVQLKSLSDSRTCNSFFSVLHRYFAIDELYIIDDKLKEDFTKLRNRVFKKNFYGLDKTVHYYMKDKESYKEVPKIYKKAKRLFKENRLLSSPIYQ